VNSVPLHPALVHLPLGLAFVLPALAIGFAWAMWKGKIQPRAWLAIVLLQAVLLGAGLVALKSGHNEEDRVESVVSESALQRHEALAEQFLWITGITLVAAGVVLVLRRPGAVQALTAVTVLGTFLVAGAAVRVGHAGGQLVYVHNAAAAYTSNQAVSGTGKVLSGKPLAPSTAVDNDD